MGASLPKLPKAPKLRAGRDPVINSVTGHNAQTLTYFPARETKSREPFELRVSPIIGDIFR
jgi:hypothetical protein